MGDGWALLFLAFLLLTVPIHFLAAAMLAAGVHELCHLGAVLLLGGRASGFRVGARGAVLEVWNLTPPREALAAAAGPAGSFLLAAACGKIFPEVALCGLGQGLYNLLPVFPLDGGRILLRMLESVGLEEKAWYVTAHVSMFTLGGLIFLCLRLRMPLAILFLLPLLIRNTSCKERREIVQ